MKTITLAQPIPYGDTTLSELKLREPKAGDLRGISLRDLNIVDVDTTLRLAARLAFGAPVVEEQLAELHPYDLSQLSQAVIGFFEKPAPSPTTACAPTAS